MLDTDTPTTDQDNDTDQIEFVWMITIQYHGPEGPTTSTRMGTVMADPERDTRASLLNEAVGQVKNEVGTRDGVVLYAYLERNAL